MSSIFIFFALEQRYIEYGVKNPYENHILNKNDIKNGNYDNIDPKDLLRGAAPYIS
jgi:hypothetical protein